MSGGRKPSDLAGRTAAGAGMAGEVRVRRLEGDAWEVSLESVPSAVRGRPRIRPRKTVHAADEATARALGEVKLARDYPAYKMGLTRRLADLALYYVDHAEADGTYTPETAEDYRGMLRRYVAPSFAAMADEATAIDFERLYSFLLASGGRDGGGISPNTVHKLHSVLCAAYAFLAREGLVSFNPMRDVELPVREEPRKRSLTEREFAKVAAGLDAELGLEPPDAAGILRRNMMFGAFLGLHTGARVGEVCALTRGQVRTMEQALRIDHSMSERGGLHRKDPKTAAGRRTVALDGDAWEALRRHYAWQATYLTDAQRDSDETPVCCTAGGGFIAPSDMSRAWKAFCKGVGVELAAGESFHVLRHTHATQLLANRENPRAVQSRLGHSKIETTFGYAHVMPGEDAATAADFGEIVDRARRASDFR